MSLSRILLVAGCTLLLPACAGREFRPADLEPDAALGAWTTFEFGALPPGFENEVQAELGHAEEWAARFQRLVADHWPLDVRVMDMPYRSPEDIPDSVAGDFFASPEFAHLDAFVVHTLAYGLEPAAGGHVPVLEATTRIMPVDGTLRPWQAEAAARGTPVDELRLDYGALADQFPALAERCVTRLMERVGSD
jgi:hypothetical protein